MRSLKIPFLWLSCLLVAASLAPTANADDLYPRCSGTELAAKVAGGASKSLVKVRGKAQTLLVECLAFEVTSMSAKGVCEIPHQTMLPFRVYIKAKGVRASNAPYNDEFDVKDVVGGSINRITVTAPVDAEYELMFANTNTNPDCLMNVRAIFTHSTDTSATDSKLPSIVNLDPRTAFEGSPTNLVIKHSSNDHNDESIFLVPVEDECGSSRSRTELKAVTDSESLETYTGQYGPMAEFYSVWSTRNPRTDNYKICGSTSQNDNGNEIGLLTVFGGNPMYFEIAAGSGEQGKIYTSTPLTLRFHGYDLDTRPYKDMAKLVDETSTCDTGTPAGGVPMATDLGPTDSYGPNTIITEWTFSIINDGGYKVCYKRFGSSWIDVPSLDDLPPGAVKVPTTTTIAPIPTNPRSKNSCPRAQPRSQGPKYTNTYLKLTFKQKDIPSFFRALLGEVLCVPSSAIVFPIPVDTTSTGLGVLYLDIECDGKACGSQDRKDYLLELATNDPNNAEYLNLQLALVEEVSTNGIITRNDHHLKGEDGGVAKKKGFFFVVGCFTLIVIAGIVVYGMLQFRKNQHHFIQFGIDDDDDVDIQEPPRVSTA
eukprot:GILI01009809.1.p1 GENE.GILI01009809.1~~GILI01009809.1.p1  ORF type:complete len:595 (+),score=159.98 GILI01009809.1:115-1899(+)